LFTRNGKGLTAQGIKPVCEFQQVFKSTYLFGAYSPITGDHFELELSHCNTETFQFFLNAFSLTNLNELKIILLDNGAFHKGKKLIIPENIILIFIPPYSPELNPAEKIWWKYKRAFTNRLYKNLEELSSFITIQVTSITKDCIKSICGFDYILSCHFWTSL
jgi:transposase